MFIKMPFLINNLCVTHAHATVWLFSNSLINNELKNPCSPSKKTFPQWSVCLFFEP